MDHTTDTTPLRRDSPFSYACGACGRCCRHYQIRVNPYEVLRLARHLGVTSGEFIRDYLVERSTLQHKPDGTCVFLDSRGCSVHPARPLACRLYPLGRHLNGRDEEHFTTLAPRPQSEGVWGQNGTVADYLTAQGVWPFIDAADRYLAVFRRFYQVLAELPKTGLPPLNASGDTVPDLLDPEKAVAAIFPGETLNFLEPEAAMARHIEALTLWLENQTFEEQNHENQD